MKTEEDLRRPKRAARPPRGFAGAEAVAAVALDHLGGVIGLDLAWTIRSATSGVRRLVGRPAPEVVGTPLRALLSPDTADATVDALAKAVQQKTPRVVPGMLSGHRPVLLIPAPTPAPSAEIYVVLTDVLAAPVEAGRPPAESADVFRARLLDVEERLLEARLLLEIAGELAESLDLGEVLQRIVDHAARLCRAQCVALDVLDPDSGLLSMTTVGGPAGRPGPPQPVARDTALAGRALATGTAIELSGDEAERESARYGGSAERSRLRTLLAVPLVDDRTPVGALVLGRLAARPFDAGAVHRARELARRAAGAIVNARRYGALRRELNELREAQARFVQAEKFAALTKLGAGAAHEINNPLAAIVGNAELLRRREPLTSTGRERVDRILQSAYRAAHVIRQLVASVRAQPLELVPTDVARVLREAVAARASDLARHGVDVVDQLEPVPVIEADPEQLGQAFARIIDNALYAVQALPAGPGRLIRLAARSQPGSIRLRIENAGYPIALDTLPRIFDPFFTTKAVGEGAGLGLSVAQGIVAAHGGRIFAENLPQAVAIVVELPVTVAGPDDAGDYRPAA